MLHTDLGKYIPTGAAQMISTEVLGMAFEPEQKFENPDGTEIIFDEDYFGSRQETVIAGPFAELSEEIKVF